MAIITLDMRSGRSDEQKRHFASAVLGIVGRTTAESPEQMYLVIREHPGINFVVGGHHLDDIAKPSATD